MANVYGKETNAQPYYIARMAAWLTGIGYFESRLQAYYKLIHLENHRPDIFIHLLDEYHRIHAFRVGYLGESSDVNAFRSVPGAYGEMQHMHYSR